jgi:hypothetical protein|tara:strand:+ start:147 stop:281 length:135 start_codon:yes stop_codon:yes gene_type:complete
VCEFVPYNIPATQQPERRLPQRRKEHMAAARKKKLKSIWIQDLT